MVTEATQLLTTTVWVDSLLGFVPRALTKEELGVLNEYKAVQPSIEERTFTRFLPTHPNHPCAVWARSSSANFRWLYEYTDALNCEYIYRYEKTVNHKSFEAARNLPAPTRLENLGITPRPLSMPDEYKCNSDVDSYRMYYMADKARMAKWKRRDKPHWWDEYLVKELQNG